MEIIFLGTSGASSTLDRNLPSIAVHMENGELLILDAGEDLQRDFIRANLKFNAPTYIFISHLHGDHVVGLLGLLFRYYLNDRTEDLYIVGPQGIAAYLYFNRILIGLKTGPYRLFVYEIPLTLPLPHESITFLSYDEFEKTSRSLKKELTHPTLISEGKIYIPIVKSSSSQEEKEEPSSYKEDEKKNTLETPYIYYYENLLSRSPETDPPRMYRVHVPSPWIFRTKKALVAATWMKHSVPTLGYRIQESYKDGRFYPERAMALGLKPGPLWKKMQKGHTIRLGDGRIIDPVSSGIVGKKRRGRCLAYSADTTTCDALVNLAREVDVLISEATFTEEFKERAILKKHMTAAMAAEMAKKAKVKRLFLTHFSTRIDDLTVPLQEARAIFPRTEVGREYERWVIAPPEEKE